MAIAVLLGVAAFVCLLLAPSSVDDALAAARENSFRYRSAALICFSISVAIYTVVGCLLGFELLAGLRARAAPAELLVELTVGATMGLGILTLKTVLH